jgi:hypothetical protein
MPPPFVSPVLFFNHIETPTDTAPTDTAPTQPSLSDREDRLKQNLPYLLKAFSTTRRSDAIRAVKFAETIMDEGRLDQKELSLLGLQDTPITDQKKWLHYQQTTRHLQMLRNWPPKSMGLISLIRHQQRNHESLLTLEEKITAMQSQARALRRKIPHEACWEKWELLVMGIIGAHLSMIPELYYGAL